MHLKSLSSVVVASVVGIGALAVVVAPGALAQRTSAQPAASAVLRTVAGDEVGRVTFTPDQSNVAVDVSVSGLPAGFHGFHIHSVGKCDAPDFTSAGAHFDPMGMAMAPLHAGDLPSLLVNQDGTGAAQVVSDRFTIDDLLAGAGTAVVVHANADNFGNIPTRYAPAPDATTLATGDAGARIACGVIQAGGM